MVYTHLYEKKLNVEICKKKILMGNSTILLHANKSIVIL